MSSENSLFCSFKLKFTLALPMQMHVRGRRPSWVMCAQNRMAKTNTRPQDRPEVAAVPRMEHAGMGAGTGHISDSCAFSEDSLFHRLLTLASSSGWQ